jgi:hypothetical protein
MVSNIFTSASAKWLWLALVRCSNTWRARFFVLRKHHSRTSDCIDCREKLKFVNSSKYLIINNIR